MSFIRFVGSNELNWIVEIADNKRVVAIGPLIAARCHCLRPGALCYLLTPGRGGEMADATDLKFVPRKRVRVRLPPPAPIISIIYGYSYLNLKFRYGVSSVARLGFD